MPFHPRYLAQLALSAVVVLVACRAGPEQLTEDDRNAIRELDAAYGRAWLAGDTAGVLGTLTDDAVLMPGGSAPIEGRDAARRFWWPDDGSRTIITSYSTSVDEIDGASTVAFVRGTSELSFTYERDTARSQGRSRTRTLTIVTKQPDGSWRIARRMWVPVAED